MAHGPAFKEESVGVRRGGIAQGERTGTGQRDILLVCRPTGLTSNRMPPWGAGREDQDLFYPGDPTSLKGVCG